MKRRSFLASIMGLAAAPFVKARAATGVIRTRFFTRAVVLNEAWMAHALEADQGSYIAFVHPSVVKDLREMAGRGAWEKAWRDYRVAWRDGVHGELPLAEVKARYFREFLPPRGEIGAFEGVRIIQSGDIIKSDWRPLRRAWVPY